MVTVVAGVPVFANSGEKAVPTLYTDKEEVIYDSATTVYLGEKNLKLPVETKTINTKEMIPLRHVLEAVGYEVQWIAEEKAVEIKKGAQWTKIYIGKNRYTRNKMAPFELSAAPTIVSNRTFVPVEFYHEVLGLAFKYDKSKLVFNTNLEETLATKVGYVVKVEASEHETKIYLSNEKAGEITMVVTAHINKTKVQKPVKVGEQLHVVTYPVMTMIFPAQIQAIVLY